VRSLEVKHLDIAGITAQVLNDHYAAISTDRHYQETTLKQTAANHRLYITEMEGIQRKYRRPVKTL